MHENNKSRVSDIFARLGFPQGPIGHRPRAQDLKGSEILEIE